MTNIQEKSIASLDYALRQEQRRNARLWMYIKRATTALTKVRPLGGSELFMRLDDECVADPEWCGAAIEDLRKSLHEARMENVRLLRKVSEPST